MIYSTLSRLTEPQRELLEVAEGALSWKENPYLNFRVGAAVLTQTGRMISGTNAVLEEDYAGTLCAEKAAVLEAISMGDRKYEAFAIIARGTNFRKVVFPCRDCKQFLHEKAQASEKDFELVMSNHDMSQVIVAPISEIMTLKFGR
jgi:cytidine deaminase